MAEKFPSLALLVGGIIVALTVRRSGQKQAVDFKDANDRTIWESGGGPKHVRAWIAVLNQASNDVAGRGAVITSWFREDHTRHRSGGAADGRRLSGANASSPNPYSQEQVEQIERRVAAAGIPIFNIADGEGINHWHMGPITRA
jgi:hypothetical protein